MRKHLHWKSLIIVLAAIAAILMVIACLLAVVTTSAMLFSVFLEYTTWREHTSPLSDSVIIDLCNKMDIPIDDPICKPGAIVYGPDFYQHIRRELLSDATNFDEVERLLGDYKISCESPQKLYDGSSYYLCDYDIRGDRVYLISVFFDDNDTVFRIISDIFD